MKLKKGMKLSCNIIGKKIKDAKIQIENGRIFICQNELDGGSCNNKLGYKYSWCAGDDSEDENGLIEYFEIKVLEKTMDDLEVGDILINEYGDKRKILGICGLLYGMSYTDNFNALSDFYTLQELKDLGYKVYQEEEPEISKETIDETKRVRLSQDDKYQFLKSKEEYYVNLLEKTRERIEKMESK